MTRDIVPGYMRIPSIPSLWEDIEDFLPSLPMYGTLNGLSISEDEKNVYIEASVPGVDPKSVDITVHNGTVWIKGEAKEEETKKKYYRKATSSYSYRLALPDDVDATKEPEAAYKNGVMTVTFARSPKTQPKKILVKTNEAQKKIGEKK